MGFTLADCFEYGEDPAATRDIVGCSTWNYGSSQCWQGSGRRAEGDVPRGTLWWTGSAPRGGFCQHGSVPIVEPEPLRDQAALERAAGGDPYVRYDACLLPGDTAYGWGDAYAVQRASNFSGRPPAVAVLGPEGQSAIELLDWVAGGGGFESVQAVTVDAWLEPQLERGFHVEGGGDWNWMLTETSPAPHPTEQLLVTLDDQRDAAEIQRLNMEASPTSESEPGSGKSIHWLGHRVESRLVAAGAVHLSDSGHGVLCGIVVHPEFRGRGLGGAITGGLTRRCVERDGVATLGVYRNNPVAMGLYQGLGYRTIHRFSSRRATRRR